MAVSQQQTFYKPSTITSIVGGLREGKTVVIIGRISQNANTLNISLKDGSHPDAETALSINFENKPPNIEYKIDSTKTTKSSLLQGQLFTVKILVTIDAYKTNVNGEDLEDYHHQIPLTHVNTILVDQNIKLEFIGYLNLVLASFKKEVTDGLKPGKVIVIYGIVNSDCKRIEINLRHRYGVAFHYLCRYEENAVVRNTWNNGNWGAEERSQDIPFTKGEFFEIKITCSAERYDVSVNGQQAHTYNHRFTKLEDIDVLEVCGGLQLFSVEAKDP